MVTPTVHLCVDAFTLPMKSGLEKFLFIVASVFIILAIGFVIPIFLQQIQKRQIRISDLCLVETKMNMNRIVVAFTVFWDFHIRENGSLEVHPRTIFNLPLYGWRYQSLDACEEGGGEMIG